MRALFLLMLLLSGCATAPVAVQRPAQSDAAFAFNGRIAVKQAQRRDNANVRWEHRSDDDIVLMGPLGAVVATLHRDAQGVTLDSFGKHYAAASAEQLTQQVLGWQLPLSGLRYWVNAMPAPDAEYSVERNANGQIAQLRQQGWEINYLSYAAATADALPLRINLRRQDLDVLLLIDAWEKL